MPVPHLPARRRHQRALARVVERRERHIHVGLVILRQPALVGVALDLDVDVSSDSEDEIGRLANAFSDSVAYLSEMAQAAEAVADGNLTIEVNPRSERDVLSNAFFRIRAKLAATIDDIARSSNTVGAASSQMAQTSQQAGMAGR